MSSSLLTHYPRPLLFLRAAGQSDVSHSCRMLLSREPQYTPTVDFFFHDYHYEPYAWQGICYVIVTGLTSLILHFLFTLRKCTDSLNFFLNFFYCAVHEKVHQKCTQLGACMHLINTEKYVKCASTCTSFKREQTHLHKCVCVCVCLNLNIFIFFLAVN